MVDVTAHTRTVRELLRGIYRLGAYQRDFSWGEPQVRAFLLDLYNAYRPRIEAPKERGYFLGPIVTMARDGVLILIDGQQRLTTLLLTITVLRRRLMERRRNVAELLWDLINKRRLGEPTSTLAELDRFRALQALEKTGRLDGDPQTESERNIGARFKEVDAFVEARLKGEEAAAEFALWLLENVVVAEVRAGETYDAFALFDAMNNRGSPLGALDQFKAYLGRRIQNEAARNSALALLQDTREQLARLGAGAEVDFAKVWMASRCVNVSAEVPSRPAIARAQLATSIMPAIERDVTFWAIREADNQPALGLTEPQRFAESHWRLYGDVYARIRNAKTRYDPELESLYFMEQLGVDWTPYDEVLLLASVRPDEKDWLPRVQTAAQFLENVAARWAWTTGVRAKANLRSLDRLHYLLAKVSCEVRDLPLSQIQDRLMLWQGRIGFDFADNPDVKKPESGSGPPIHSLLARLTAHLDFLVGQCGTYVQYEHREGSDRHEIEHLLPRQYSTGSTANGHRFRSARTYKTQRQRLGALVLLRGEDNRRFSDSLYPERLKLIGSHSVNLLVKSVYGSRRLPSGLGQILRAHGIVFPEALLIDSAAVDARQLAYRQLAEATWSAERIRQGVVVAAL